MHFSLIPWVMAEGQVSLSLGIVTFEYCVIVGQVVCAFNLRYICFSVTMHVCMCRRACISVGEGERDSGEKQGKPKKYDPL